MMTSARPQKTSPAGRRTGRRPGESGAREAILEAARDAFAAGGYERATIRGVGRAAGVDPALVLHYFGSKRGLFEAAMRLPFDPAEALPRILAGDPDTVGRRLAEFAVGIWEREETRRVLLGVVRAAASDPGAAAMLREVVGRELFSALATSLPGPDPQLRANLAASQIVGLGMARHVIQVQPLASADPAALVEWLAPTLQRYLTGAAPGGGEGGGG